MKQARLTNINLSLWAQMAIALLWVILCFAFFQSEFHYHFFDEEQNQIFLLSGDYISSYYAKPAWLACLCGDFLTQFYYYLYAGPAILTISLAVLGALTFICLKDYIRSWGAFVVALLLVTLAARFSLAESYKLSSILSLIGAEVLWLAAGCYKGPSFVIYPIRAILVALTYWMFGYGVFLFIVLELISTLTLSKSQIMVHLGATAVILLLTLFGIKIASHYYNMLYADALEYPGISKWVNYDDVKTMEKCLSLENEYYFKHYSKVKELYEGMEGEKNQEMTFYYCLSLEQLGMLPQSLPTMNEPFLGTFLKISEETPLFDTRMINNLYYLLGDMTYTERAAIMANTFSPNGRNVRMIKRLAEVNLISGDIPAAMKYLRILSKTLVYRQWAKEHTPGSFSPEVKAEIEDKKQFVNTNDDIRVGDDCYVIMVQLLNSNPKNLAALDYLLCSDMLAKQRDVFIRDYEQFGEHANPFFRNIYASAKAAPEQ